VTRPKSLPWGRTRASAGAQQHPGRAAAGQGSRGPNPALAEDRQPCPHLRPQIRRSSPPGRHHEHLTQHRAGLRPPPPIPRGPPVKRLLHHDGHKQEQSLALSLKKASIKAPVCRGGNTRPCHPASTWGRRRWHVPWPEHRLAARLRQRGQIQQRRCPGAISAPNIPLPPSTRYPPAAPWVRHPSQGHPWLPLHQAEYFTQESKSA